MGAEGGSKDAREGSLGPLTPRAGLSHHHTTRLRHEFLRVPEPHDPLSPAPAPRRLGGPRKQR